MAFRPARAGIVFKDGKLRIFSKSRILVLKGPPDLRAWEKTKESGEWRPCRPDLNFADQMARRRRPIDPEIVAHTWLVRRRQCERKAFASFLAMFPDEVRRRVLRFPERQWHLLQLATRCPGALDILRDNPALAFCLASNWAFHRPGVRQPLRSARALLRRPRKEIAAWLGFEGGEAAVRILRKIPYKTLKMVRLFHLQRTLRVPEAVQLLMHAPRLNAGALLLVGSSAYRPHVAPTLLVDVALDRRQDVQSSSHHALRDTLEMLSFLGRPRRNFRPRSVRRLEEYHDQVAADRGNPRLYAPPMVEAGIPVGSEPAVSLPEVFPPPPFPAGKAEGFEIQPITCRDELEDEAREMRHCVWSYAFRVARGACYIFRMLAPERATFEMVPSDARGWKLVQIKGYRNRAVGKEARLAVARWVKWATDLRRIEARASHADPLQMLLEFA